MILREVTSVAEMMWGEDARTFPTKVKGICEAITSRHGGYLVDINIHPDLKNYGDPTRVPNIRAFEEDYEALKVLWLYPQLINNPERADEWLNEKTVVRYEPNSNFLKEFPTRRIFLNEPKEEEMEI